MRKNLRVLILLGSLALNVAFVVAWAAPSLLARPGDSPCGKADGVGCPLYRRLGVTADQWRKIEPRLKAYQDRSREYCLGINRSKNELIDLVAAPEADRKAIEAKQKDILAGHEKMQTELVDHLLAEKKVLNPDQQARLFGMLRSRGCEGCGPCGGPESGGTRRGCPGCGPKH
jgi:Spy/CpxP family protein refolding chaperone